MKALVRRDPAGRMLEEVPFLRDLERLFGEDLFGPRVNWLGPWREAGRWYPPMDVEEADDHYLVTAELPGLAKGDIDLTVEDNRLVLSGEREWKGEEDRFHHRERAYGKFTRTYEFPAHVDAATVKAKFKDGVLTITLPKVEQAKAKKVAIN